MGDRATRGAPTGTHTQDVPHLRAGWGSLCEPESGLVKGTAPRPRPREKLSSSPPAGQRGGVLSAPAAGQVGSPPTDITQFAMLGGQKKKDTGRTFFPRNFLKVFRPLELEIFTHENLMRTHSSTWSPRFPPATHQDGRQWLGRTPGIGPRWGTGATRPLAARTRVFRRLNRPGAVRFYRRCSGL